MINTTHKNSKIVIVKSKLTVSNENQEAAEEWFADHSNSIGSYYANQRTEKAGTGLEAWEERILFPQFLNMDKNDKDFRKEIDKYFHNINTKIPYKTGLTLEVGLESNNDEPVSEDNMPLNLDDYVKYRQIRKHPFVAPSEDMKDAKGYSFYIVDGQAVKKKERLKSETLDKATTYYLEVKQTPKDVDMHLSLLGIVYKAIDKEDRASKLRELITTGKAEEFIENYNDGDNKVKFFINRLVSSKIIAKEGSRYIFEGVQLGATEKDFIEYLNDDVNSETVGIIKAREQELRS